MGDVAIALAIVFAGAEIAEAVKSPTTLPTIVFTRLGQASCLVAIVLFSYAEVFR